MIKQLQKVLCALYSHGSRLHCVTASSLLWQKPMLVWQNSLGNTAQFVGSVGDAFSAICRLQIFRLTASKPSKSAVASGEKIIRHRVHSFVRYGFHSASVCWLGFPWGLRDWQANDSMLPLNRDFQ